MASGCPMLAPALMVRGGLWYIFVYLSWGLRHPASDPWNLQSGSLTASSGQRKPVSSPTAVGSMRSEQPVSSGWTTGRQVWGTEVLLVQRRKWGSERCLDQGPHGTGVRGGGGSFPPRQENDRAAVFLIIAQVSLHSSPTSWGLSQLASQRREPRLRGSVAGQGHPAGKQVPGVKARHLAASSLHSSGPAPRGPGSRGQASDLVSSGLWPRQSADLCFLGAGGEPGAGLRHLGEEEVCLVAPELSQQRAGEATHSTASREENPKTLF